MIKKKLMRPASLLLVLTMSFSLIAGCKKEQEEDPESSAKVEDTTSPNNSTESATDSTKDTTKEPTTEEAGDTTEAPTEKAEDTTEAPTQGSEISEEEILAERRRFETYTERMIVEMLAGNFYYISSMMEQPEKFGITAEDITDYSLASYVINTDQSEAKKQNESYWEELKSFDYEKLSDEQKLTYDKLTYEFDITERGFELKYFSHPLDTMNGIMSQLGIALYNFQFDNLADVEGYQKMLETIPDMLEQIPVYIQYQIDNYNYFPSDSMISSACEYSAGLRETENNPLLDGYDSKIDEMTDISAEEKEALKRANKEYVTNTLFGAFENFEKAISKFDTDTNVIRGLANYEGGKEYYDYMIKAQMGLELDASEMFELLEKRLQKDLEEYTEAYQTGALLYISYQNGTYKLPYDKKSVTDIFEYYLEAMSEDFPMYRMPEYDIQDLPPALQIDGLGAYYMNGEFDDSSKKIIRINPKVTGEGSSLDLDLVLIHEGIAGHMLQYACAENNLYIDQLFSELGYTEGWAMYAELTSLQYAGINSKIATWKRIDEMFGYYLMAMTDLGVNGMGWSDEDAADFLSDYIGDTDAVAEIVEEVASSPGSLIPYALGYVITDQLMETYKEKAGENVNLLEMHEKYMSIGNSSFDVVSKYFLGEE